MNWDTVKSLKFGKMRCVELSSFSSENVRQHENAEQTEGRIPTDKRRTGMSTHTCKCTLQVKMHSREAADYQY